MRYDLKKFHVPGLTGTIYMGRTPGQKIDAKAAFCRLSLYYHVCLSASCRLVGLSFSVRLDRHRLQWMYTDPGSMKIDDARMVSLRQQAKDTLTLAVLYRNT